MGYVFPVLGDYRISSGMGARSSPGGVGSTNHQGIDIRPVGGYGTPVLASVDGTIQSAGTAGGYGNMVVIQGSDGQFHRFAHLQGFDVRAGQQIAAGQQIGQVGSTGNSTGPHLHYEVRNAAGRVVNPEGILSSAVRRGTALLREEGEKALGKAAASLFGGDTAVLAANAVLPGSGTVLSAFGVGSEGCGWLCQFQNWIKESGFFQRLALAFLAFIIIAAAFYMMKSGVIEQVTGKLKGK
jgi:hypothetical protein